MDAVLSLVVTVCKTLLSLSLINVALSFIKNCTTQGMAFAMARLPQDILTAPLTLIGSFASAILGAIKSLWDGMIAIVMALLQMPLTLAWSAIPGLDKVCPEPKIRDLF